MFADDSVLLADSEKGLWESINRLKEFCGNCDLSSYINSVKTKIVIFYKLTCDSQIFVYYCPHTTIN